MSGAERAHCCCCCPVVASSQCACMCRALSRHLSTLLMNTVPLSLLPFICSKINCLHLQCSPLLPIAARLYGCDLVRLQTLGQLIATFCLYLGRKKHATGWAVVLNETVWWRMPLLFSPFSPLPCCITAECHLCLVPGTVDNWKTRFKCKWWVNTIHSHFQQFAIIRQNE